MRSGKLASIVLPLAIIIAGYAVVFALGGFMDEHRAKLPAEYEDQDLTINGSRLKGFVLGADGLIADWYWMRSLQYIGGKIVNSTSEVTNIDDLRDLNPRLLYPYLNNATDLDPHFIAAYNYGAIVLPAIDPSKAIAIAQKGIANNPNEWRLYQYLGYIYWKLKQYDKAADIYERGSEVAGSAPFMKLMAASMKTEGGSRATARMIYQQMLEGTDDEQVKVTATRRLQELDSFDERDAVDKVLAEQKEKRGQCPANLSEILPLLVNVKLPDGKQFRVDKDDHLVDPTDAPYLLDKEKCRITPDFAKSGLPKE